MYAELTIIKILLDKLGFVTSIPAHAGIWDIKPTPEHFPLMNYFNHLAASLDIDQI
jgi:hypothetical protein